MIPMQKRPRRRNDSSTEMRAPKHGRRHTDTETRGSKHGHRNMGAETRAPKHGHRNTDAETRASKRERQSTDAEIRAPKHESRDTSAEKRTSRHSCPIVPVLSITESTTVSTINIASSNGIDVSSNDVAPLSPPAAYKQTVQSAEQMALDAMVAKVKPSSYGRRRNYSSIDISAEKWLMHYDAESLAKLENPPSLADGIGRELERDIRYLGCELIQSGAILLRLNQTSAATAQILFQRYYYLKSFVRYNFEHMVQACLLLASKIEEEPRKPRDVLNVYNRLRQIHHRRGATVSSQHPEAVQKLSKKFEHLELSSKKYQELKNIVIKAERRLLNVLGFVVHVHHPHKLIYIYLHILGQLKNDPKKHSASEIHKSRQLLQKAWSYMNDGLRTDMFLRYRAETIACACIQLAVRTVDKPIVLPTEPFAWFELFDASDRDVRAISQTIWELYMRTKAPNLKWISDHLEQLYQKTVAFKKFTK